MRRATLALGCIFVLAGCQGVDAPGGQDAPTTPAVTTNTPEPGDLRKTALAIFRKDGKVQVGDTWEQAAEVFPAPKRSFEVNDPPGKLTKPYRAKAWESSTEGFGIVTYNDKALVAAMYQLQRGTKDDLDQIVDSHLKSLSNIAPVQISGTRVKYWFWEQENQRLMICGLLSQNDVMKITVAVGDRTVMTQLGMAPALAQQDQAKVDEFFSRKASPEPAK